MTSLRSTLINALPFLRTPTVLRFLKPFISFCCITCCAITLISLGGCHLTPVDPRSHQIEICIDCPTWQQQLGEDGEQLTEEERRLLTNYSERILYQQSQPKQSPLPSQIIKDKIQPDHSQSNSQSKKILVAKVLIEQRHYERLHPFNPTGKPLPLSQRYPITVLALPELTPSSSKSKPVADEFLYPQRWQLSISNLGTTPVKTFSGSIQLSQTNKTDIDAAIDHKKTLITVPLTQFVPPIPPNKAGDLVVDVPKAIITQLTPEQLAEPTKLTFIIKEGEITLENGKTVNIVGQRES